MKSRPTNLVLDFANPSREMLQRDGEDPIFAVLAAVPDHSETVANALDQLGSALIAYMDPDDIVLMLQDVIQLQGGTIIELTKESIFFSLSYPTADSRMFEMQLGAPATATLH
jgi:hypothetical protein